MAKVCGTSYGPKIMNNARNTPLPTLPTPISTPCSCVNF